MGDFGRQDVGQLLGLVSSVVVGASVIYLLSSFAVRSRIVRAGSWFLAWGLGGLAYVGVFVVMAGRHFVWRQRGSGGWLELHWSVKEALFFASVLAVIGALLSLSRPRARIPTRPHQHAGGR